MLYRAFFTGDRFGGPIDKCERICIPFNWERVHWLLIVADLTSGTVLLLDSLPAKNELENNLPLAIAKKLVNILSNFNRSFVGKLPILCTNIW